MSSIYKSYFELELEGSSHSEMITLKVKNFPKDYKINYELIEKNLKLRRPSFVFNTPRIEEDKYYFKSGVENGKTTGDIITICVLNNNKNSSSYTKGECRANHADYPAYVKYGEEFDYRGGGQFSGRMTVPFVILGSMCSDILATKNIEIATRIKEVLDIKDDEEFDINLVSKFNDSNFPMVNENKKNILIEKLSNIKDDTVGGMLESYVLNLEVGVGDPFFDSLESKISHMLFSIPSCKGVMFGDGINLIHSLGSEVIDQLEIKDDKINIKSNHMGGINGGLSNGNPIKISTIFKPIASIKKPYNSINIINKENIELINKGRHDIFMLNRCCVIVNSFLSLTILDILLKEERL